MTVLRMTSPVTPPSTSPGSPDEAQPPQPRPIQHRLSFSVAALLADTKKSPERSSRLTSLSPSTSPGAPYPSVHHRHHNNYSRTSPSPKYSPEFASSRYSIIPGTTSKDVASEHRIPPHFALSTSTSPKSASDVCGSTKYPDVCESATGSSPTRHSVSNLLDERISGSPSIHSSGTQSPIIASSTSPKLVQSGHVFGQDFGAQSPRSSHEEGRSRCSELEDIDDEDEGSLVDVEDLQQHTSSPTPVRPTPAYIGGFSTLGSITGLPASLHSAVWGAGHQNAAAAAAAAAAAYFPAHFSHHAPLNGKLHLIELVEFIMIAFLQLVNVGTIHTGQLSGR